MGTVIVVGSGAAGLTAALGASREHEVVLLTKAELGESNSLYAQGGVAAALSEDDSTELHLADTLRAAAGAGDEEAARVLCEEGPQRVRELIELGVDFDRDGAALARGQEGAHSLARVLHAGGDATGRAIVAALTRAVRASGVRIVENAFLLDLVVRDGVVVGVEVLRAGVRLAIEADAVVVASGGAGQLFLHTTNPAGATGDGVAAALRAGARLADAEFYQFHPTALAVPGTPLVSEAVRGEGAVLRDANGVRFMLDEHPDAELAPRDVVARAISRTMARQGGEPVLLDCTGLGTELAQRFPGFWALCAKHGFDPSSEGIPVTPAAHYWMGGIETDLDGRSSIPGLFAIGEAACTGAHGANRLASNSLLEALVFAHRVVDALEGIGAGRELVPDAHAAVALAPEQPAGSPLDRRDLQKLMWRFVGLERDAAGLTEATHTLDRWSLRHGEARSGSVHDLETANLLEVARAVVAAAAERTHSLGAHWRSDDVHPERDTSLASGTSGHESIDPARKAVLL
ncbi:L-aspartate oxidase [Homoserinimonas aerilata]|uniref:L-aspartate oxidase n=1 Tax=Homoserinimonas aerilata TaxID=1162970 RepID=A0A542YID3_9MICO|nr:L-aspartate oxidase [Homoserinimonas aerilata]TQL47853.1 L-aspartate oxidase [Homoserinimonas aerilata]